MFRIDTPNRHINLWGVGKDGFRDGDKALGVNPTELSAAQQNALQEEILAVIEAAGGVPNKANNAQLLEAIQRLIDAQSGNYALDTGAANAYVVALTPAIVAYADGMTVRVKAINKNTGASTLNAGGGVVGLVNDVGGALADGDIPALSIFTATFITADNKFRLTSMVQSQADARYASLARGSLEKLGSAVALNSALIAFTGLNGALYSEYLLIADNVNNSAGATGMLAQISAGAGFVAAGYSDMQTRVIQNGATGAGGSAGATGWNLHPYAELLSNVSYYAFNLRIACVNNTNANKRMFLEGAGITSNGASQFYVDSGGTVGTASNPVDGLQVYPSSGTFLTGNFTLYGVRA